MTGRIVALVDGSIYSASVCEHAAWIAGRTGQEVELMHVLGRREGVGRQDLSGSIALGARSALLAKLADLDAQRARLAAQQGRAILEDAKDIVAGAGVAVATHLRHGDLLEAIAEREAGAEMVLIGKRGEAADFARGHLGSNLDRVMRAVRKPLFIASRALRDVRRVLIAYDGSAAAMRAVDYVARSRLHAGLDVTVVTVGVHSAAAERGLADAAALLSGSGRAPETRQLPGQPEEVLAALVEEAPFDHVVMGASGHSRLRAMFVGSTTLGMIRRCKVPLLLVR